MQVIRKHKVTLLTNISHLTMPFYEDVEKIYLSYKQCYSKDELLDNLLPVWTTSQSEIDKRWSEIVKIIDDASHPFWSTPFFKNFYTNELHYTDAVSEEEKLAYAREEIFNYYAKGGMLFNMIQMCLFIQKHKNHESPLEHGSATVQISDFPRILSQQITRHRIGVAISQQSQRYVSMQEPDKVKIHVPSCIEKNAQALEIYTKAHEDIIQACQKLKDLKDPAIRDEDIRMLYTNAFCTEMTYTMNFRAWKHFFEERCCMTAQHQTRTLANDILHKLQLHIPFIFDDDGPKCYRLGYCPEGRQNKCQLYTKGKAYEKHTVTDINLVTKLLEDKSTLIN